MPENILRINWDFNVNCSQPTYPIAVNSVDFITHRLYLHHINSTLFKIIIPVNEFHDYMDSLSTDEQNALYSAFVLQTGSHMCIEPRGELPCLMYGLVRLG